MSLFIIIIIFLTGNIWFYCCPYTGISFYFIGSPISFIAKVPDTYIEFIIIIIVIFIIIH